MKAAKKVHLFCLFLLISLLSGCTAEKPVNRVQTLSNPLFSVVPYREGIVFSSKETAYYWNPQQNQVRELGNFFYKNEARYLTVIGERIYTIAWNTGAIFSYDAAGNSDEMGKVYNDTSSRVYGQIWNWDGKICCLTSGQEQQDVIQIRDTDGSVLQTVDLAVKNTRLCFAYGDYLFYQQSSVFGPSHIFDLRNGKDYELGTYLPCDIVDEKLLVKQHAYYDEDGAYQFMDGSYYLLDGQGNKTDYPAPENGYWLAVGDEISYAKSDDILYAYRQGKSADIIEFHGSTSCVMLDEILYMQSDGSFYLLSDSIVFADATGENAEAAAKANQTRIFVYDGRKLTLALTPDGSLYLLRLS